LDGKDLLVRRDSQLTDTWKALLVPCSSLFDCKDARGDQNWATTTVSSGVKQSDVGKADGAGSYRRVSDCFVLFSTVNLFFYQTHLFSFAVSLKHHIRGGLFRA
jgi:hypothetical protein